MGGLYVKTRKGIHGNKLTTTTKLLRTLNESTEYEKDLIRERKRKGKNERKGYDRWDEYCKNKYCKRF